MTLRTLLQADRHPLPLLRDDLPWGPEVSVEHVGASEVATASVRELIALLASSEDRLRGLRAGPWHGDDGSPDERTRDDVLHLQGRVVRELRRRRGQQTRGPAGAATHPRP